MKHAPSEHSTTRQTERAPQKDATAGQSAISIAPPAYGIDSVDREPAGALSTDRPSPIQAKSMRTGLPDKLKAGVESMSGLPMDDVRVHYNSSKPAQLQAWAYTQGTDIHVAPGQEKHLPHEAWHVVQQKQGRVKPTLQLKALGSHRAQDVVQMSAPQHATIPKEYLLIHGAPSAVFSKDYRPRDWDKNELKKFIPSDDPQKPSSPAWFAPADRLSVHASGRYLPKKFKRIPVLMKENLYLHDYVTTRTIQIQKWDDWMEVPRWIIEQYDKIGDKRFSFPDQGKVKRDDGKGGWGTFKQALNNCSSEKEKDRFVWNFMLSDKPKDHRFTADDEFNKGVERIRGTIKRYKPWARFANNSNDVALAIKNFLNPEGYLVEKDVVDKLAEYVLYGKAIQSLTKRSRRDVIVTRHRNDNKGYSNKLLNFAWDDQRYQWTMGWRGKMSERFRKVAPKEELKIEEPELEETKASSPPLAPSTPHVSPTISPPPATSTPASTPKSRLFSIMARVKASSPTNLKNAISSEIAENYSSEAAEAFEAYCDEQGFDDNDGIGIDLDDGLENSSLVDVVDENEGLFP